MVTFSPNYSIVTVAVWETRRDSMQKRRELNKCSMPRNLNCAGMLPLTSGAVGVYRSVTGIADVVSGIAQLIMGKAWLYQTWTGASNVIRGAIEFIPTAVIIAAMMEGASFEKAFVVSLIPSTWIGAALLARDGLSCSYYSSLANSPDLSSTVTILYDNVPAIALYPRNHSFYTPSGWVEQADEYGTRLSREFV